MENFWLCSFTVYKFIKFRGWKTYRFLLIASLRFCSRYVLWFYCFRSENICPNFVGRGSFFQRQIEVVSFWFFVSFASFFCRNSLNLSHPRVILPKLRTPLRVKRDGGPPVRFSFFPEEGLYPNFGKIGSTHCICFKIGKYFIIQAASQSSACSRLTTHMITTKLCIKPGSYIIL